MVACNLDALPSDHSKKVVSEIIEELNYLTCQVMITPGSGEGENRLGEIIKVKITGTTNDNSQNSTDLVLKLSPAGKILRELVPLNRLYIKEVYAYTVLFRYFETLQEQFKIPFDDRLKFVKCFKSSAEESNELIIMEDLSTQGFQMFDRLDSFDLDHLELSIKNLARIHAFSFVIKANDPKLFDEMASHASNSVDFGDHLQGVVERGLDEAMAVIDDPICAKRLKQFSINIYDKYCQYVDPNFAAPYNIICHGDCWPNNFLFKYMDSKPVDIRTIDWQIIRNASPVTDISYMIYLSTDEKTREEHFPRLLDLYYDTLRLRLAAMGQNIDKCYPKKAFRDHLKRILPYGFLFSLFALPITMSARENAPDMIEMFKNGSAIKKETFSVDCIERLRGIARDVVKHDSFN